MKKFIALLALLGATHAFAGGLPTTPYIYVQGSAETKVAPDTLVLNFSVSAQDKDQVVAKKNVSEKSSSVFELLAKSGFKDEAITAQDLSVNSNFDYVSGQRVFTGYTVSRQFSVKFTDFNLYAKLADALVALRVDSINPVQASFADARAESAKLKSVALANARKEADDLAASLNATVTGVFAASPIPFPEISSVIFGGSGSHPARAMSFDMRSAKGEGDKYVFDDITLNERLHVIFLIQPKS